LPATRKCTPLAWAAVWVKSGVLPTFVGAVPSHDTCLFASRGHWKGKPVLFFSLSDWALALLILTVIAGVTAAGIALGRFLRKKSDALREPFGALQGALLGVVGLILAFGLTLAVGRYQDRRAAVVAEANAIGTTYLRAQLLAEPVRGRSLVLLREYARLALRLSSEVPGSSAMLRTIAAEKTIQRQLWGLAGQALAAAPVANAPRLYVESLNDMIDQLTVRASALGNRVPAAVLRLELLGAAVALSLLGLYLSVLGGRAWSPMLLAAALVTMLLLITFDLDRPVRGLISIPSAPYQSLLESMNQPPGAHPRQ